MSTSNPHRRQANQYDKILKENLEISLPEMIREVLGLQIVESEELPDDLQHTKERKPDALKRVTDALGNTYVLHIEFQLEDEPEMVYRMAEYSIMLGRQYKLPIKQYVLFLKEEEPIMPIELNTPDLAFRYTLVQLAKIDYRVFLHSQHPEVKMLGLLANFKDTPPEEVVNSIVQEIHRMKGSNKGSFAQSRYFQQMRIFVQLRKSLEPTYDKIMQSVSTFFKEEDDFFYKKGLAKGEERGMAKGEERGMAKGEERGMAKGEERGFAKGEERGEARGIAKGEERGLAKGKEEARRAFITNLILKLGLSDEQAADTAEVSLEYVKKIRAELYNSKN